MSDWSADGCSSDLQWRCLVSLPSSRGERVGHRRYGHQAVEPTLEREKSMTVLFVTELSSHPSLAMLRCVAVLSLMVGFSSANRAIRTGRSEEHTSELQSLMRISYAVFCLKKKKTQKII